MFNRNLLWNGVLYVLLFFFFQAEDGIRDAQESRGLGDVYKRQVYHIASQMQLPVVDRPNPSACVPTLIVMNVMIPLSSPSMFSQKTNGPTLNAVVCFVMRESTAEALADLETAPASVRLLHKYFASAPMDGEMAARIKLIGMVVNWEETRFPSMFKGFNGKPVLVTKSGSWYSTWKDGQGHAELDVNLAHWAYMPRKALSSLWSDIGDSLFDFGVVIEAREEEEMPEQMLVGGRLNHLMLDGEIPKWEGSSGIPDPGAAFHWQCVPDKKAKVRSSTRSSK
eukprot:TRINITY_DN31476_c0_g1_i1.p1 TRINITY_DN31476_c0_g1~~TRINITY_DN31476_c0_g1_i1.p1  ORF type:complete len:281 (-),score=63.96 TRINITY_DN31476_c0_g1_i1:299-1141(-)